MRLMTVIPIGSESAMLAAIRARKDELRITNETIDAVAGLPNGYASKLLCEPPRHPGRGPGRQPGERISSRRRPPWLINAERSRQFADLRMAKLTAQQRSTIARNAAAARWKRCSR